MEDFYRQVYAVVNQIPEGKVTSYGRIAQMLMQPNASRAVGYALRALGFSKFSELYQDIPWHRVVNHQGVIRVHTPGEETVLQVEMLREEGVDIRFQDGSYRVNLKQHLWKGLSPLDLDALFAEDSPSE